MCKGVTSHHLRATLHTATSRFDGALAGAGVDAAPSRVRNARNSRPLELQRTSLAAPPARRFNALSEAHRRETAALGEYMRVLEIFHQLMIKGGEARDLGCGDSCTRVGGDVQSTSVTLNMLVKYDAGSAHTVNEPLRTHTRLDRSSDFADLADLASSATMPDNSALAPAYAFRETPPAPNTPFCRTTAEFLTGRFVKVHPIYPPNLNSTPIGTFGPVRACQKRDPINIQEGIMRVGLLKNVPESLLRGLFAVISSSRIKYSQWQVIYNRGPA